jgi:N-acetylmuramic acid 6-phosphate (MurNAc-6-P) etherase
VPVRARRIIRETTGAPEGRAEELLREAGGSVRVAVVMGEAEVSSTEARTLLDSADGSVRQVLDAARLRRLSSES